MPANNTIWVLGDSLLTEAAGHYGSFKKRKGEQKSEAQTLYIENMYAIRLVSPGIYTDKQARNMPNIVLNSLVETLNLKAKVPHTIVILVNDYRFWNHCDILTHQMERILARFFREIRRIIEDRNLSLPPRAVNWDYPRLFITRAMPLPNGMTKPYPKGFKQNRRKYNRLVQRGEVHHNYRSINLAEFTSENNNKLFAPDGTLTKMGHKQLWISISDAIHKADNQDRINMNKVKAKQLATQVAITNSEMRNIHAGEDLSDVEPLQNNNTSDIGSPSTLLQKPTKRALLEDFNRHGHQQNKKQKQFVMETSPQSEISEYYTMNNRQRKPDNREVYHKQTAVSHFHNKHFNRNKGTGFHRNKSNWRHKQC